MKFERKTRPEMRTKEEVSRDQQIRARFQAERPSIEQLVASGEYAAPVTQGEYLDFMELMACFREARQEKQLSLTELAANLGMDKAALSRLETGASENPTYFTLLRIATSLGKRLRFVLDDMPAA